MFRGRSSGRRFFFLLLIAFSLMAADLYSANVRDGRAYLSLILTPLQWIVDVPSRLAGEVSDVVVDRSLLLKENAKLKSEALLLERKVQQNSALWHENDRLRSLLVSSKRVDESVQLVELIGVNPDPFQHQVIINKGSENEVVLGQPILDAGGVMGQVTEMSHYTSRVMLITDARHALPVEINRNGFRTIALGKGQLDELELDHVPDTADIKANDLVITSGLGGRFPRGYPVAIVSEVIRDPGQQFARVRIKPTALLDKSRHLLLVTMPAEVEEIALPLKGEVLPSKEIQ
ncbi:MULTISPECIES: rod shape-determining protein MreC [unclassified Neptuniibacter]|uniref:rod shape-determining protein MreC n=1 Tax=unclassified Neptuniibacter TaxID=2630693 RepID=UPI000C53F23F|nr:MULTISPECIES: rod shape-determining protein MreC [unclassified Neptuniibacter]MAY42344.1 rod shape-determining protein MreC [Oceanospirillaceae bacterium]